MDKSTNLRLWLPEDSDPLEVSKLSENFETLDGAVGEVVKNADPYKVGDTLTTWRTDLGENWLLCNGDILHKDQYQSLCNAAPPLMSIENTKQRVLYTASLSGQRPEILSYATDGTTWAAIAAYPSGYEGGRLIYFTNDDLTDYSINESPPSVSIDASIFFVNGKWFVCDGTTKIYESDSVEGTFTEHTINSGGFYIQYMEYRDGKYWAFGGYSDVAGAADNKGAFTSFYDLNLTGFSTTIIGPATSNKICSFVKTDKYEFIFSRVYNNSPGKLEIYSSDNPGGEYTLTKEITNISQYAPSINGPFKCDNGLIYSLSYTTSQASSVGKGIIYLDENRDIVQVIPKDGFKIGFASRGNNRFFAYIKELDAFLVFGNYTGETVDYNIAYISRTTGDTVIYTVGKDGYSSNPDPTGTIIIGKHSCSFLKRKYSTGGKLSAYHITAPFYSTPCINLPQSYTYIKAKEDAPNANQQTDTPAP